MKAIESMIMIEIFTHYQARVLAKMVVAQIQMKDGFIFL
jgi:hypothetical protein